MPHGLERLVARGVGVQGPGADAGQARQRAASERVAGCSSTTALVKHWAWLVV